MIRDRITQYEEHTGNRLPMNVVAKISQVAGTGIFISTFVNNGTTKDGLLAFALVGGGAIADKMSGGYLPYERRSKNISPEIPTETDSVSSLRNNLK